MGVGGTIGPIVAGFIFDQTQSYLWTFIAIGVLFLVATIFLVLAGLFKASDPVKNPLDTTPTVE